MRSGSDLTVKTHSGRVWTQDVESLSSLDDLFLPDQGRCLVAVDEAQFFGCSLTRLWERIATRSAASTSDPDVLLVAGLDLDFRNEPFGDVLNLVTRFGGDECCEVSVFIMRGLCLTEISRNY
jgi:thymidine kinase